jgi:hypothetical protein
MRRRWTIPSGPHDLSFGIVKLDPKDDGVGVGGQYLSRIKVRDGT